MVVVLGVVLAGPVWAQDTSSATITGVVRDTSGAVLPGVTVEAASPALIEQVRTVVTDAEGRYRVTALRSGVYSLSFTLPGFCSVRREGLELTTGFTATINTELSVGALEETIAVTGQAPLVDTRNSTQQTVISGDLIRSLPLPKNSGAYVTILPGAVQNNLTNMDVGGTKGETTTAFGIPGGRPNDGYRFREGLYDGALSCVFGSVPDRFTPAPRPQYQQGQYECGYQHCRQAHNSGPADQGRTYQDCCRHKANYSEEGPPRLVHTLH